MAGSQYIFTPEDDQLAREVNRIVRAHPELFKAAGQRIDEVYSTEAVVERQGEAFAKPAVRFFGVVDDFFRFLHPPMPSPGSDWATDLLLCFWLATHEGAGDGGTPRLTEFQAVPWKSTKEVLGRDAAQLRDGTGKQWPAALDAVRRALGIMLDHVGPGIPEDLPAAVDVFVATDAEAADQLLDLLDAMLAALISDMEGGRLRRWGLGRRWPVGSDPLRDVLQGLATSADRVGHLHLEPERVGRGDGEAANRISGEAKRLWLEVRRVGEAVITALRRSLSKGAEAVAAKDGRVRGDQVPETEQLNALAPFFDRARERCSGARLERIESVLRKLHALDKEWLSSAELDSAGISAATVYAHTAAWQRGKQYRGASSRAREYLRSAVMGYVASEWTPKRKN